MSSRKKHLESEVEWIQQLEAVNSGGRKKKSIKGPRRTPAMADTHLTSQEDSDKFIGDC